MILAVDVGNTHLSFGCVDGSGSVDSILQIATDTRETAWGYAAKMRQVLQLAGVDVASLTGAALACVVPPVADTVRTALQLLTGTAPLTVGAGVKTGLAICIDDPGTIAADLVAAAVAAKAEYPLPCVVVDMGTATTLTVVDEKGRYIGGAILPGVGISLEALAQSTALLPRVELTAPQKSIATNTVDSIRAGAVYGAAGAVDGILERYIEALGGTVGSIVATGGLAAAIAPHCRHAMHCDSALVLKGLGLIWQKNRAVPPEAR